MTTETARVAQDVTESTMNDRAMSAMANELRQLIDKANAPIFGIDVEGNVNEWNEKTAEITGYSRKEADNQPLGMIIAAIFLNKSFKTILVHLMYLSRQ